MSQPTILVADDSVTIQTVVGIAFAKEPFAVVKCGAGDEAITKARELKPLVVLADHSMPGADGYAVAQALKADPATAGIPVLLLSGSSAPFDEGKCQAVGAAGHMAKPFDCQSLIDRVNELVGADVVAAATAAQAAAAPAPAAPTAVAKAAPSPPMAPGRLPSKPAGDPFGLGANPAPAAPAAQPAPAISEGLGDLGLDLLDDTPAAPAAAAPVAAAAPMASVAAAVSTGAAAAVAQATGAPSGDAITAATREIIEKVVWEVVPELAETLIREEIRRLLAERS